jgi:hypothetical protein
MLWHENDSTITPLASQRGRDVRARRDIRLSIAALCCVTRRPQCGTRRSRALDAQAALAEARKECQALQAGRTACLAEASAQHRSDLADARSLLLRSRSGGK